jgi:hypothetical protein
MASFACRDTPQDISLTAACGNYMASHRTAKILCKIHDKILYSNEPFQRRPWYTTK